MKTLIAFDPRYVAGVIDSDGSISINKRIQKGKYKQHTVIIQITWLDIPECRNIFYSLKQKYGGAIYDVTGKGNRLSKSKLIRYSLESKSTIAFLEDVSPYLIIKKEQAKIAMKLAKFKKKRGFRGRGKSHTKEDWKVEEKYHRNMVKLNRKGKN